MTEALIRCYVSYQEEQARRAKPSGLSLLVPSLKSTKGGRLIGFGAHYAGGCTSGHAIGGLANLQLPSLVAVISFFLGGLLTTHLYVPAGFGLMNAAPQPSLRIEFNPSRPVLKRRSWVALGLNLLAGTWFGFVAVRLEMLSWYRI